MRSAARVRGLVNTALVWSDRSAFLEGWVLLGLRVRNMHGMMRSMSGYLGDAKNSREEYCTSEDGRGHLKSPDLFVCRISTAWRET